MNSFFQNINEMTTFDKIVDATYDEYFADIAKDFKTNVEVDINPITLANKDFAFNKLVIKPEYSQQLVIIY